MSCRRVLFQDSLYRLPAGVGHERLSYNSYSLDNDSIIITYVDMAAAIDVRQLSVRPAIFCLLVQQEYVRHRWQTQCAELPIIRSTDYTGWTHMPWDF